MRQVERTENGRYKVRFRHGVSAKTGKPKQCSESFDRKRDADDFARWLDALGSQGALDRLYAGDQAAAAPTLDQLAADHIRYLTGIEDGTRLNYERLWSRTWAPLLGRVQAHEVTKDRVAEAVNSLGARYSEKSLANQRGLLSAVLDRAVEHGHLTGNPAKGIRLPRGAALAEDGESEEMVFLSLQEWSVLYEAFPEHHRPLVRFLAGTGCRWGEAVAVRRSDVDLTAGTVKFRRALKWSPDGKRTIGVTKTRKSKRTVALPGEVIADLEPLTSGRTAAELVFRAPRGGEIYHRTFWGDYWRPAIWRAQHCAEHTTGDCRCGTAHPERCKVHADPPPPCDCPGTLGRAPRIHDLRHSHASWLLAAGVPIHVVSRRLGHESIQTTVDTYGHLLPDAQILAAEAASLVFQGRSLELLAARSRV